MGSVNKKGFTGPRAGDENSSVNESIFQPESNLIEILQDFQEKDGYLSKEAMLEAARLLSIPAGAVWGVATFYNHFRFTPPAKKPVYVCLGTACHLAGGQLVLEAMARELKLEIGGTTPDLEFSLERVACIGCCALAPVVTIGGKVYPKMTQIKVEEVLVHISPPLNRSNSM